MKNSGDKQHWGRIRLAAETADWKTLVIISASSYFVDVFPWQCLFTPNGARCRFFMSRTACRISAVMSLTVHYAAPQLVRGCSVKHFWSFWSMPQSGSMYVMIFFGVGGESPHYNIDPYFKTIHTFNIVAFNPSSRRCVKPFSLQFKGQFIFYLLKTLNRWTSKQEGICW